MGVQRQLQRWVDAGVLDPESAKKIEAYEASQESFSIGTWILGLGIVAIGIGVIALVASNWDGISPGVKLACDVLLLLVLAWAVLRTQGEPGKLMRSELCIGILFFFTLASMALVGQIYQLDVPMARSLLTWFAITTPLLLLSKTSFLAAIWALLAAVVYLFQIERLEPLHIGLGSIEELVLGYVWAGPLLFRAVGSWSWFDERCSHHAAALRRVSDLASIVGAGLCSGIWYDTHGDQDTLALGLGSITLLLIVALLFRKKLWPQAGPRELKFNLGLWGAAWLSMVLGLYILRFEDLPVIAALFQLAMIGLMIGHAVTTGKIQRFRFWIGAACLRLLIVYFEVFGSLLDTGLALVIGGILIVVLAGIWRKVTSKWETKDARNALG